MCAKCTRSVVLTGRAVCVPNVFGAGGMEGRAVCVPSVFGKTAVLGESWRHLGASLSPLRGLLGSPGGPPGAILDHHEVLRERIEDDLDSEPPPKSIGGACLKRNGCSGGVSEASWRHLRPPSGPLVPFWGPLGAITDRREALRERIQSDLHLESPSEVSLWRMYQAKRPFW